MADGTYTLSPQFPSVLPRSRRLAQLISTLPPGSMYYQVMLNSANPDAHNHTCFARGQRLAGKWCANACSGILVIRPISKPGRLSWWSNRRNCQQVRWRRD